MMEQKNENITRQTAYIVCIRDITNSNYVKTEGEWTPNYLEINSIQVSRINLMGVVISVSEEENSKSFVLDDGSGSIQVRIFDQTLKINFDIGEIVMVIGKPREFNNEKYIVPEIIKILNEDWLELRKKQIKHISSIFQIPKKEKFEEEVIENTSEGIFKIIKELDKGDGVYIDELIKKNPDAEKIVQNLLNEGEVFEIKPGKIKLLE
jgi:RPA family protein